MSTRMLVTECFDGNQEDKDLAREVSAQICNVLNTQHPTIDWPHSTISMLVESALATVRREAREAAWRGAILVVSTRLAELKIQTAESSGLAGAACLGRDFAIEEILRQLEASANQKGEINERPEV